MKSRPSVGQVRESGRIEQFLEGVPRLSSESASTLGMCLAGELIGRLRELGKCSDECMERAIRPRWDFLKSSVQCSET